MSGKRTAVPLTPKQHAAVEHYLANGDMTAAYRHAYACNGRSKQAIYNYASQLFALPHVAAEIKRLRAETEKAGILSRQEALDILTRIAQGQLPAYLGDDGEIDPSTLKAGGPDLEQISTTPGEHGVARRIKVRSPIKAIERIAKMCGWDQRTGIEAEGITINLNMGDPPGDVE